MTALTILIPAHNEAARIGRTLEELNSFIEERPDTEVVIVDDGSQDETGDLVRRFQTKQPRIQLVILSENQGKGAAFKAGAMAAKGELVLMMDADLSAPLSDVARMEAVIQKGADLAIGIRVHSSQGQRVKRSFVRWLSSRIFNGIVQLLILPGVSDSQCGFKIFKRTVIQSICQQQVCNGFSFDIEIIYLARKMGYALEEIPVSWDHQAGSKTNLMRDSIRMVYDIFYIKKLHG